VPKKNQRIFIAGGTGFVGNRLRRSLNKHPLRIGARSVNGVKADGHDDVEFVELDLVSDADLDGRLDGCWAVVNLVAIIEERGNATFDRVIRQGTERLVEAAKRAGITRFVQISAIGARDEPAYPYFQAKYRAEQAVIESGLDWTILRPSIVFGQGDGFISRLADVIKNAPVMPILGSGESKFQPLSVIDLGDAIAAAVFSPDTSRRIVELAGPDQIALREMMTLVAEKLGRAKPQVKIPIPLMRLVLAATRPLPARLRPPITIQQLKMLDIDNTTPNSGTSQLIGREPRRLVDGIDYILSDN
jgi:NADH dehydrogenase